MLEYYEYVHLIHDYVRQQSEYVNLIHVRELLLSECVLHFDYLK